MGRKGASMPTYHDWFFQSNLGIVSGVMIKHVATLYNLYGQCWALKLSFEAKMDMMGFSNPTYMHDGFLQPGIYA